MSCKTPGAVYQAAFKSKGNQHSIVFTVELPPGVTVDKYRARLLEKQLHDTFERAAAEWFCVGGWHLSHKRVGARCSVCGASRSGTADSFVTTGAPHLTCPGQAERERGE